MTIIIIATISDAMLLCSTLYVGCLIYSYKVGILLAPTLQVEKLRPKEGKESSHVINSEAGIQT